MMHPSHNELRRFCDSTLEAEAARQVELHLRECEFCREFCEEYQALSEAISTAGPAWSSEVNSVGDRLYRSALSANAIELWPFLQEPEHEAAHLAADGRQPAVPRFENLATFFSESPEVILRVMRDNNRQRDYLQLVGMDADAISHVLVEAPDARLSVLTDENGRGELEGPCTADLTSLRWQIRMPDAEFTLLPLEYDPDRVEYSNDVVLETSRQDRVAVRFEGQTEGHRISLRILELDGRSDFDSIRVAVSQSGKSHVSGARGGEVLHFEIGSDEAIEIRLFRD